MDSDASAMELLFAVESPLTSLQLASLMEAGLTLVLYQRGQIPLPYQQLEKSALHLSKEKENGGNVNKGGHGHGAPLERSFSNEEEVNPRARISSMIQERRERALMRKLEKQRKLGLASESKAYNAIRPALEVLESFLTDVFRTKVDLENPLTLCNFKEIVTVALILGPSVYCPKEIYFFDLPSQQMPDDSTVLSKLLPEQFKSTILRQFYKKLITNPDLLDFTSRPLATTYSHLCVISTGDLDVFSSKNPNYRNVVRLPSIPPAILHSLNVSDSLTSGAECVKGSNPMRLSSFTSKAKSKCFRIKIHQNRLFEQGSMESTTSDNDSFSSDTLFDSNSFSCYQIPLRFKGVPCKNKGL